MTTRIRGLGFCRMVQQMSKLPYATLERTPEGYRLTCESLTRGEACELLLTVRRLELYRIMEVDTDIVESAARTMAQFEVDRT